MNYFESKNADKCRKKEKSQLLEIKKPKGNAQRRKKYRERQKIKDEIELRELYAQKCKEYDRITSTSAKSSAEFMKEYLYEVKLKEQSIEINALPAKDSDAQSASSFFVAGGDATEFKRHCVRASTAAAEEYINESLTNNIISSNSILNNIETKTNENRESKAVPTNEIKVFCPKCNTKVLHTAEGIQQDQTKAFIAKVYHYFEQEYEELKNMYVGLDLTPLSKFGQRTALATGVRESTVLKILQEEESRNDEEELQEPPHKKSRQTETTQIEPEDETFAIT